MTFSSGCQISQVAAGKREKYDLRASLIAWMIANVSSLEKGKKIYVGFKGLFSH